MQILSLDFETASLADLKKTGASRYSRDASTIILVCAWAIGDEPVKSVTLPDRPPQEIVDHIAAGGVIQAYNALFEQSILENVWGLHVDPSRYSCTMQRALYAGLPRSLDAAGSALDLSITKDKAGHDLMMRMCKPRAVDPVRWWHVEDKDRLERLRQYCVRDVEAERELARNIPELPDVERRVSLLDRNANNKGVLIDRDLVHCMAAVAADATKALNKECADITGGAVKSPGTNVPKLLAWLGQYAPENLTKDSVAAALKRDDLPADVRRVLEIRQEVAKASAKKLIAMLATMDDDDRIRGVLQYYGASRTGRWAGRFIQPQNFPRPTIKSPNDAIDFMEKGAGADMVEAFYGPPLNVVASCLRGMLIPSKGCSFVVSDASQIEARVLAWLAGQNDVLEVFARGEDVYVHTQKKMGLNSRQEAKVAVLGLGFQMGPAKFADTAAGYGLKFDEDRAKEIVFGWRNANPKIAWLWKWTNECAKEAVKAADKNRVATVVINDKLSITVSRARNGRKLMTLLLPSGRRLFYRDVEIVDGEKGERITFMGLEQGRWVRTDTYGGKLVENATQATARDILAYQALDIDCGELVLSVHDELIYEVANSKAQHALDEIMAVMSTAPEWAEGLPCACDAHILNRYGK